MITTTEQGVVLLGMVIGRVVTMGINYVIDFWEKHNGS